MCERIHFVLELELHHSADCRLHTYPRAYIHFPAVVEIGNYLPVTWTNGLEAANKYIPTLLSHPSFISAGRLPCSLVCFTKLEHSIIHQFAQQLPPHLPGQKL